MSDFGRCKAFGCHKTAGYEVHPSSWRDETYTVCESHAHEATSNGQRVTGDDGDITGWTDELEPMYEGATEEKRADNYPEVEVAS